MITDAQEDATAPLDRTSLSMSILHNSCDGTTSFSRCRGEVRAEFGIERPRANAVPRCSTSTSGLLPRRHSFSAVPTLPPTHDSVAPCGTCVDYPKMPAAAMAAFQTRLPRSLLRGEIAASRSPKPSEVKAGGGGISADFEAANCALHWHFFHHYGFANLPIRGGLKKDPQRMGLDSRSPIPSEGKADGQGKGVAHGGLGKGS